MIDVPPLMVAGLLALGGAVLVRAGPSWVVRWRVLTRGSTWISLPAKLRGLYASYAFA